ncbi:MAG: aminotransferase class IV [Dehalogenimonas sp.]
MLELAYVDGVTTSLKDSKVPVTDSGFNLGYGVFETMRSYHGGLFRFDAHLNRLKSGAAFLGIQLEASEIEPAVFGTLEKSQINEARVRLSVTVPRKDRSYSIVVTVERYQPPSEEDYNQGLSASIFSTRRKSDSPMYRYKTLNQLENSMAKKEAEKRGGVEAIFINEDDYVVETNRGNIFAVVGGLLKTPSLDNAILPGITRGVVLELASRLGIPFVEADTTLEEFRSAKEAFLTSSLVEIMPFSRIEGKEIGDGKIGNITNYLRTAYKELVLKETGLKQND